MPRRRENARRRQDREPTKQLQAQVFSPTRVDDGARNWAACERAERLERERGAGPRANLPDVGDLGDQGRPDGRQARGKEAEGRCEDEDAGVVLDRYPEGQAGDSCQRGDDDHDVVPADLVCEEARYDTPDDTVTGG